MNCMVGIGPILSAIFNFHFFAFFFNLYAHIISELMHYSITNIIYYLAVWNIAIVVIAAAVADNNYILNISVLVDIFNI